MDYKGGKEAGANSHPDVLLLGAIPEHSRNGESCVAETGLGRLRDPRPSSGRGAPPSLLCLCWAMSGPRHGTGKGAGVQPLESPAQRPGLWCRGPEGTQSCLLATFTLTLQNDSSVVNPNPRDLGAASTSRWAPSIPGARGLQNASSPRSKV